MQQASHKMLYPRLGGTKYDPPENSATSPLLFRHKADTLWKPAVGDTGKWTVRVAFRAKVDAPKPTAQPVVHSGTGPWWSPTVR